MFDFESLDKELQIIPSKEWRLFCGSYAKEKTGKSISRHGVSSEMWAQYRVESGIPERQRRFTQYEAIKIFIRVNWRLVCSEVGTAYIRNPETTDLIREGKKWFSNMPIAEMRKINGMIMGSCIDGKSLLNNLEDFIGKKVTERTLRRICAAPRVPTFRRRKFYTIDEIRKIIQATREYYSAGNLEERAIA